MNELPEDDKLTPEEARQMAESYINERLSDELDMWVDITCVGDNNRRSMHLATGAIRDEPAKRGRPRKAAK